MIDYLFKFVTWAAVSKDEQVEDKKLKDPTKASIPTQLRVTRQAGEKLGGKFIDEYICDGYSRTAYWNLDDAIADIPDLKRLLRDIHKWDVVICKNYDRFGSLAMMLFHYFNQHKKQMFSVQQATQIYSPSEYNPGVDIAVPSMINSASQNQTYRIAKIVDAFTTGLSDRARRGLYTTKVPQGYVKIDKETLQVDPRLASLLVNFPKWFLSGLTIREIARRANATGILSRDGGQWNTSNVKYILLNPFYSGKVFYFRGQHDKETGTYLLKDDYALYDGSHEAMWDFETYEKIQAEFKRRWGTYRARSDYNLTGLLKCSECGATLIIRYGHHRSGLRYWFCPGLHTSIRTDRANQLVTAELRRLFSLDIPLPESTEQIQQDYTAKELAALQRQAAREKRVFDAGGYEPEFYAEILKGFRKREAELQDVQRQKKEAEQRQTARIQTYSTLKELVNDPAFERWISDVDPRIVKHHLSRVVKLTAHPNKTITAELI